MRCRYLINAAGNGAADISHMAGAEEFQMVWRQGNIVVLDKEPRTLMPLYPVPTPVSKGVIVTGTVHGNTVITATAAVREPGDTQTYASDVNALLTGARKLVPDLDTRRVVRDLPAVVRSFRERTTSLLDSRPWCRGCSRRRAFSRRVWRARRPLPSAWSM